MDAVASWWKSLFSHGREEAPRATLDPRSVERAVERLADTPNKTFAEAAAKEALELAHIQVEALRSPLALYYSTAGMNSGAWMEGAAIASFIDRLAEELESRALAELEDEARLLCVEARCILSPQNPEEIFPPYLKRGECNERLGRIDVAVRCYSTIAADFEALELAAALRRANDADEDHAEPLEEAEEAILECAEKALLRLAALAPNEARAPLLEQISARLEARDLADVIAFPARR